MFTLILSMILLIASVAGIALIGAWLMCLLILRDLDRLAKDRLAKASGRKP